MWILPVCLSVLRGFVCVLKGGVNWLVHFPLKCHPPPSPLLCSSLYHIHTRRVTL